MEFAVCTESQEVLAPAYVLTPNVRVRNERSGLLFYDRNGPRLYFLSSGDLLTPQFFASRQSLARWCKIRNVSREIVKALERALERLERKGVVHACKAGT